MTKKHFVMLAQLLAEYKGLNMHLNQAFNIGRAGYPARALSTKANSDKAISLLAVKDAAHRELASALADFCQSQNAVRPGAVSGRVWGEVMDWTAYQETHGIRQQERMREMLKGIERPTLEQVQMAANKACHELYKAFLAADEAWSAELQRVYGKQAGDARYDERGVATATLQALYAEFKRTGEAWRKAVTA